MTVNEIARRLSVIHPLPEFPGEREWVDRLRSVEDVIALGPLVADEFRQLFRRDKREFERRRAMCPELLDLLFEVFPSAPRRR